jgi:acyl-CoA hydrolase
MDAGPARRRFLSIAVALSVLTLTACGKKAVTGRRVAAGAAVLALGDSITFGTGASAETAYPAVLAKLTGWNVANAGVPGDTSAQALERLPALLQEYAPQLVLVSIGGNDFLRRVPEAETRANVRQICQAAQAGGAQVLLIAIPAFTTTAAITGSLSDHPMYQEIAQALRLPLHANGWSAVLSDPGLRSDPIHANAQGYERFARSVLAAATTAQLV